MDKAVDDYLKSDRQWLRAQRIDNAKYNLSIAPEGQHRIFWMKVLKRLED